MSIVLPGSLGEWIDTLQQHLAVVKIRGIASHDCIVRRLMLYEVEQVYGFRITYLVSFMPHASLLGQIARK